MKLKLVFATILYLTAFLQLTDWVIFSAKNSNLALRDSAQYKRDFVSRFSEPLQPLFSTYGNLTTSITIAFFIIAGIIFLRQRKTMFKLIAITAFAFAFWDLFSLV